MKKKHNAKKGRNHSVGVNCGPFGETIHTILEITVIIPQNVQQYYESDRVSKLPALFVLMGQFLPFD